MKVGLIDRMVKNGVCLSAVMMSCLLAADGVTYHETKLATEPIPVADGVSTFRGSALADKLIAYWAFDDADDLGKDSSGNGHQLEWARGSNNTLIYGKTASEACSATNECKRGKAVSFNENYCGVLRNVPSELDGTHPFTVAFWFYVNPNAEETGTSIAYGYLGLGNATNSNASSTMNVRMTASDRNGATAMKAVTFGPATGKTGSIGTTHMPEPQPASFKSAGWVFMTMTYTPNSEGTEASYNACLNNNSTKRSASDVLIDSTNEPENYVLMVGACRYQQYLRTIRKHNVLLDEVMVFSDALDDDQLQWIQEHTKPADFGASWALEDTGILNLAGSTYLQDVFGAGGEVCSPSMIKIGSDASRWFGGCLSGKGGVEFAPVAGQTILLTGTNSYAGKTTIKSGTVRMLSSGVGALKETFRDNLRAFWSFDRVDDTTGWAYDWSGNGNDLTAVSMDWATSTTDWYSTGANGASSHAGLAVEHKLGTAFGQGTEKTDNYFQPNDSISGFDDGVDNSFTISIWAKTAEDAVKRSGFLWLDNNSVGMRYVDSPKSNNSVYFGNKNDCDSYMQAAVPMHEGEEHVGGGDWHHYLMTYDKTSRSYTLYIDGDQKATSTGTDSSPKNLGKSNSLRLGRGLEGAEGRTWHGWLDDVVLLNRAATAEEVEALYAFRSNGAPAAGTGLLPSTTELSVESGATVALDIANETVSALSGNGTIALSSSAKLSVSSSLAFYGTVMGSGKLVLPANLVLKPTSLESQTVAFMTAPSGVLQVPEDKSGWTLEGVRDQRNVSYRLRDNGDGTETLEAKWRLGLILVVR